MHYTKNAVEDLRDVLSDDQLKSQAPSVFATEPYHAMSARYVFVPTINLVNALRAANWLPVSVQQNRVRIQDKQNFTKHLIRFQNFTYRPLVNVGDVRLEVSLVNSHDGASTYNLILGVWRASCKNGLMVPGGEEQSVKLRHTGDIAQEVVGLTTAMAERAPELETSIQRMLDRTTSASEMLTFGDAAMVLRYGPGATHRDQPTEQLLRTRRVEDSASNLWTIFNRVQENMLKGGQRFYHNDEAGRSHRRTTRRVKSITETIRLNRGLWTLADSVLAGGDPMETAKTMWN